MGPLAIVAALALAGVGGGQTGIRSNLGKTMPQTGGVSPVLAKYVSSGTCGGTLTGSPVTVTRATSESILCDGTLTWVAGGTAAVDSSGVQVFGATTQALASPTAFDAAAWVPESDGTTDVPVVTAGEDEGADCEAGAGDEIAVPAVSGANKYSAVCQEINGTAARWSFSVLLKGAGASANPYVYIYRSTTYYRAQCLPGLEYTSCYVSSTANLSTSAWKFCIGTDLRDASQSATAANTFIAWGAQGEASAVATPYIGTGTRNADAFTATNPLGTTLTSFAISGRFVAQWGNGNNGLWGISSGSNTNRIYSQITTGKALQVAVYGSDSALNNFTSDAMASFTPMSSHDIKIFYDSSTGVPTAMVDGVAVALTKSGTAAAMNALGTTLYLGNSGGSLYLGGRFVKIHVCQKVTSAGGCPL